jgi:hypothetical protein
VGFVYVLGAAVVWIRLSREHLPTEAVITSLPRGLLLSVGLRSIVVPVLVFALLACAALVFVAKSEKSRRAAAALPGVRDQPASAEGAPAEAAPAEPGFWGKVWHDLQVAFGSWVAIVIAVLAVSIARLVQSGWSAANEVAWWGFGAVIVVLLSAGIASTWPQLVGSDKLDKIALIAVVVSVVAAVARLGAVCVDPGFEQVAVCTKDTGSLVSGLFIGETDNGIYLGKKISSRGETQSSGKKEKNRVLELPRDRFEKVVLGSSTASCPAAQGAG